jgi:hypothetical protein
LISSENKVKTIVASKIRQKNGLKGPPCGVFGAFLGFWGS